jgi:type IV pilus assembly protein PilF
MRNTIIKIITTSLLSFILVACTTTTTTTDGRKTSKPNLKEASDLNTQLAVGYIQREQYKSAKDKLEKAIEQDSENVAAVKTLAYLYALLGLEEKAREQYTNALDITPNDPDLLNSYGAFLCSNGKLEKAQVQFKKAYDDPFYESLFLAQSNAGSCYVEQGEYKKAEPLLRKSLRLQPNLPGSLLSMAEVGVNTERYLMARAYIERYHAVRAPGAESLWIQLQAEKALGAHEHYLKYAKQLINDFPDSDEAGWAEAETRNEQFR